MSAVNCSACATPFPDGTIDTTGVGMLCETCLSSGTVDDPMAMPKRAAVGAAGLLFASQCVSFRTSSSTESTFNGHGERTTSYGMDVPQFGVLAVVLGVLLFGIANLVKPFRQVDQRARAGQFALGFGVLMVVALWRLTSALPSTVTTPL